MPGFDALRGLKSQLEKAGDTSARVDISGSLKPWTERTNPTQFWAGLSEKDALEKAQDVHNFIQRNRMSRSEARDFVGRELKFDDRSANLFASDAIRGERTSRFARFGEAHTAAGEEMFADWIGQSRGNTTEMLGQITGDPQVTDLRNNGDLIDVQNRYGRGKPNNITIETLKQYNGQSPTEFFNRQSDDKTVGSIIEEFKRRNGHGDGKLMQTRTGAAIGRGDRNMSTRPHLYGKDYLIGGTYDTDSFTNLVQQSRGPYNPTVPQKVYGIDLPSLRGNIFDTKKGDLERLGIKAANNRNLQLNIPFEHIRKYGGGTNPIDMGLISDEVAEAIQRSRPDGVEFRAGLPIESAVQTGKQVARNKLGGITNTVLSGASREAGKKFGQGDIAGGVKEVGTNYAIGAALEEGVRRGAQTGLGKRITNAVGSRMAGAGMRTAAGSAGSGGLLAPVLGTIAVADLADGVVEGVTGKDTIQHINDGVVQPYYQKSTGDQRSPEQIQTALSGPSRTYQPEQPVTTPVSAEQRQKGLDALSKALPEVPQAPIQSVTPTISQSAPKPTTRPTTAKGWWQQAQDAVMGLFGQ